MLVKKYRKQKKLTQKEVAQKIGINERQYQRIESGESFATQKVLNALEDLFEKPSVYFWRSALRKFRTI